jgi:hypothetical protein
LIRLTTRLACALFRSRRYQTPGEASTALVANGGFHRLSKWKTGKMTLEYADGPTERGRTMTTSRTGGCLCGKVRYSLSGDSFRSHLCHCRDCQHFTGTAFGAGMFFPTSAVSIQGELKVFHAKGSSGQLVHRHFCPDCGSSVVVTGDKFPDAMVIQAGTLDDPAQFVPTTDVWTQSAVPWAHSVGGPRTEK